MDITTILDLNAMAPHEIIGAMAQLLLALAVFGNMLLSWQNNKKITAVHITADKAVATAQAAVGDAVIQLQDVKTATLQARDEVIVAIKNGNGHK